MFTGLVECRGTVRAVISQPPGVRLVIAPGDLPEPIAIGASVAVAGCCLTVVACDQQGWAFEAGPETLERTSLGTLRAGSLVNVERSLHVGDSLGGHFVTGHIDAVSEVLGREDQDAWSTLWFSIPRPLAPQLAAKGSIAVDGVSLTLVEVRADRFSVQLIPHTLQVTTLGALRQGDQVNLETDVLAKYVAAQLAFLQRDSA